MAIYHASHALLEEGWAPDVLLEVTGDGTLSRVEEGVPAPAGTASLSGPVVPGLPNLHSHAFQRAMAGLAETGVPGGEDDFWSWRSRMYDFLERLTPDDVRVVATQLYVEMLRAGYTSVAEFHYLHHDPRGRPYADPAAMGRAIVEAARSSGLGLTLLPVLYAHGDFGGAPPEPGQRRFILDVEAYLTLLERLESHTRELPDMTTGLAFHSLRAVTPEQIRETLEGAGSPDVDRPVHIHAAEQLREVEACLAWSGARPVDWLLENAPVDARWCLVHATHLEEAEIRGLARSGAVASLCPSTEADLGDGVFPLSEYLAHDGAWGVGSDSHVVVSPAQELRILEYGQRLTRRRRNVAAGSRGGSTGMALLRGALAGGAQACGRRVGRLSPGARADLVVLDPDHPSLACREGDGWVDGWIFAPGPSPVTDVMVSGAWRVRDGHHPLEDEARDAYRTVLARLLA